MKRKSNKGRGAGPKRMQDRGYKALTVYLKMPSFRGLKRFCFDEYVQQGAWIRDLVEGELKRRGYL